jgi:hypothetical protein
MVQILVPLAIAWLCARRAPIWDCDRDRRRRDRREPVGFPPGQAAERKEPPRAERTAGAESGQNRGGKKVFRDGRRFGRIRNSPPATGLSRT